MKPMPVTVTTTVTVVRPRTDRNVMIERYSDGWGYIMSNEFSLTIHKYYLLPRLVKRGRESFSTRPSENDSRPLFTFGAVAPTTPISSSAGAGRTAAAGSAP